MKNLALAKLQALSKTNSLPHAWLFLGSDQTILEQLALQFASWLLCEKPHGSLACGTCKSCSMLAVGSHPDYFSITMQEDKQSILLDDVRELSEFINKKPQFGKYKIVLLYPAEKMNLYAANALLKNLEDPGPDSLIILLSSNSNLLLKTIVSRCQQLIVASSQQQILPTPDEIGEVYKHLKTVYLEARMTKLELVELLVKRWPNEVLYWFELALADLIVCTYTQNAEYLRYPEMYEYSKALSNKIGAAHLWQIMTKVQQARCSYAAGQRPNLQLILEDAVL